MSDVAFQGSVIVLLLLMIGMVSILLAVISCDIQNLKAELKIYKDANHIRSRNPKRESIREK